MKRIFLVLLALLLILSGCAAVQPAAELAGEVASEFDLEPASEAEAEPAPESLKPDLVQSSYYYDVESVVLYLHLYGVLPPNYITKDEARDLGWEGGSVEEYLEGAAIGGDFFGNYEGILPKANGRSYTECDIDTLGASSRGAKRLIFSNDGLYFYTEDHYESFTEYIVDENGEVQVK